MESNVPASNYHAGVVGGSMAGLLAARVLSESFGRVTIVERDGFPEGPHFARGFRSRGTSTSSCRAGAGSPNASYPASGMISSPPAPS